MGLREWGLAAIILGTAGCSQPQETRLETRLADEDSYYERAVALLKQADKESDKKKREDLYANAFNIFEYSRKHEDKEYDCLLRQADCISHLGDYLESIKMVDDVIVRSDTAELKANAFNFKGNIALRHEFPEMAEQCYTQAIKLKDSHQSRWNRYEARMKQATRVYDNALNIRPDFAKNALEDLDKCIEFKPEEPDAFLAKYLVYGVIATSIENKEEQEKVIEKMYFSLKSFFTLVDKGREMQRESMKQIPLEPVRDTYKKLEIIYKQKEY
jgi:tetratricopeptide (TPR) repeat protein